MNSHDIDRPDPDQPTSEPAAVAAKPRRRKVAAAPLETPLVASESPEPRPDLTVPSAQLTTDIAPAKPRRARRPSTAATSVDNGDVESSAAGADAPAPAAYEAQPSAPAPANSSIDIAPNASGQADGAPAQVAAQAGEEMAPRRSRNRRRGRRGDGDRVGPDGPPTLGVDEIGVLSGEPRGQTSQQRPPRPAAAAPVPVDATATFADVLAGIYDTEPEAESDSVVEAPAARRVLAAEPDAPKLHKLLAQSGIGSRRDMEQLIEQGQVTVNDQPAHVGQRISFGDQVRVSGRLVKIRIAPPPARVLAYHKPVGEVVTHDDPQNRPTVFRRLPRLPHGKWQSVGRLDINTEGLLLFTNSGDLANQLMHPRFGVEREYAVRVLGSLDSEARAKLLDGVDIEGQRAAFKSIEDGGGEGVNHWYRVVITEGRNREVRKLFDRVGLGVSRLIRIRYGCVVLPKGLKRGVFVDLNDHEVREVRRLAGGREPGAREPGGREPGGREQPAPRPEQGVDGAGNARRNRRRGRADRPIERGTDRPVERPVDNAARRRDPIDDIGPIPNPLQQTFDKRAIREARQPRREYAEDGPIPNPLEQTYDKRFVQKPRGLGDNRDHRGGQGGGQPDPMKTSMGYIGADAFVRKFQGNGGGGHGGGGGRGGGAGGGGGGGGRRRGGR